MKAYIGGDDVVELQQKARGFKTYRDIYNKKVVEQENMGKTLRDQQKDVKVTPKKLCAILHLY
jgi:intraflagellar transport protein 81